MKKNKIKIFQSLSLEIKNEFKKFSSHVFIFSTGIAVRIIAPLLQSKIVDPAIVVVDDQANHAISLISGHIGGANSLTKKIAAIIHAVPVITTATDINNLPSIDMIAQDNNLLLETPQNIKHINMAFLKGDRINLYDPFNIIKEILPDCFWMEDTCKNKYLLLENKKNVKKNKSIQEVKNIFCSHKIDKVSRETLILRPPVLAVGIGCNRGTSQKDIQEFMFSVLDKEKLSVSSIYRFGTTSVKKDEKGLLQLSEKMKIKIDFYDNETLNSVKTIKNPSRMVQKHLGVKSVCEASAILSSNNGELIVTKQKNKDVTIAVAIKK
jgi:cobalt-precorrin 5A hydrolase